jgi:hypothetical protein
MKKLLCLLLFVGLAHAQDQGPRTPHKIKKLPPNCAYINGQLRCWVIDPLPEEELVI